jgi:DNA polymerase-3 subunit delta'
VWSFERQPEQEEAKRLLRAALTEGPAHAYLFHGPRGVGKRSMAFALAGELLGDADRVERRSHPDLYVLEPLGDQIRIDAVRELRRDLHMRPFESGRRVYLILGADLMNEEAADALLKDLEEPPDYAVLVLVASEPQRLPETIRSRCQHVPFRRLSRRAVEDWLAERSPESPQSERAALSRVAAGRLDRAGRLLDPSARERRDELIALARSVYLDPDLDPGEAASAVLGHARRAGEEAAKADAERGDGAELTKREQEQRSRRVARGAERQEILDALELLAGWYRDVLASAAGAVAAALNSDRAAELAEDGARVDLPAAERAVEAVAETRRTFELNVSAALALEAMFIRLRWELGGVRGPSGRSEGRMNPAPTRLRP